MRANRLRFPLISQTNSGLKFLNLSRAEMTCRVGSVRSLFELWLHSNKCITFFRWDAPLPACLHASQPALVFTSAAPAAEKRHAQTRRRLLVFVGGRSSDELGGQRRSGTGCAVVTEIISGRTRRGRSCGNSYQIWSDGHVWINK